MSWLWFIANAAKTFGISPIQVREDLADDTDGLYLKVLPLFAYAEAHAAYRRANKDELKAWRGNRMMDWVWKIDTELLERG